MVDGSSGPDRGRIGPVSKEGVTKPNGGPALAGLMELWIRCHDLGACTWDAEKDE